MTQTQALKVTKANGERAAFQEERLRNSMLKSGASREDVEKIIKAITAELYDGIPTRKIYSRAFELLASSSKHLAARYNLKNAIMELGPSGFPFERYLGKILESQGYRVQVGQVMAGHCVTHEIDVLADKEDHHFMVECKYHNQPGTVSDVKIPLYVQSRFIDVETQWKKMPGHDLKSHQGWVATNTRFTSEAIKYGNCMGLKLLGWDYPAGGSLKDIIDGSGLYPLTCLISLSSKEKKQLLQNGVVLCLEVCQNPDMLSALGIKEARVQSILAEGRQLCSLVPKPGVA